jgi:hypothetical protein
MKTKSTPFKIISLFAQNISRYNLKFNEKFESIFNFKFYKFFLITSLILLISINMNAQNVVELNKHFYQSRPSINLSLSEDNKHLKSLIYELNSSVIIKKGILNTFSNAPFLTVDIEANSISKLNELNPLFREVELIIIRINNPEDLSIIVDTANLTQFPKLRYIYFLCSFNCTSGQINNLIKSENSQIKYLYLISIPS